LDVGFAYDRLGDAVKAEELYQKAVKLDPRDPAGHYQLGRLFDRLGNLKNAESEYQLSLTLDDSSPDVHFAYGGLLIKLGNRQRARKHLQRAVALYPDEHPLKAHALNPFTGVGAERGP